jgi:RimJ/RimL family protein N-acetyltransferase
MIRRYTDSLDDAAHINAILNHPSVHPWVAADDNPLDLTATLAQPDRYALFGPLGGQLYHRVGDGIYEVHSAYLPEARGRVALATTRETLRWMFGRTDAVEIITRVPKGNLAALALARAVGMRHMMTLQGSWIKDGRPIVCDFMRLAAKDWTG